ncbi:hypothetical protein BGX27_005234 [Mortierella sp. AM989]|nr:hypothetical protein BGX27_005234 [Mortierella sp. AM989]
MGVKTRKDFVQLLLSEIGHYKVYFYAVIPLLVVDMVLYSAVTDSHGGHSIFLHFYAFVVDLILYRFGLISLGLALVYLDLVACGFNREALIDRFSTFKFKDIFTTTENDAK